MIQRWLSWGALLLLAAVLGTGWIVASREEPSQATFRPQAEAPHVGNLAPDFTVPTLTGETVSLADLQTADGRPVVLNFWATWCPPCRVEMPFFQRLSDQYAGQVAIVGVNQAESAAKIAPFAEEFGLTYPLLVDEDLKVNNRYGVLNLPTTIFIDGNGVVREVLIGTISQAVLEDRIQDLLGS